MDGFLDTFFVAFEHANMPNTDTGPDEDGFLSAFVAFQEEGRLIPPLVALENMDGFMPFALSSLYWALLGKPDAALVDAYPLLACAIDPSLPPEEEESDAASHSPAPKLLLAAQKQGQSVLVVGTWLRSEREEPLTALGKQIRFAFLGDEGHVVGDPTVTTIGVPGRGLSFAVWLGCPSLEAVRVRATAPWVEGEVCSEAEIATAHVTDDVRTFAKELDQYTRAFVETGVADNAQTMKLLKQCSRPPIQNWVAHHPMRLALVYRAQGTKLGLQWAKAFSIPNKVEKPAPPVQRKEAAPFPTPQASWDSFVGWALPDTFVQAIANVSEADHAKIVETWGKGRYNYWLRGTADLRPPRPLDEVLSGLRKIAQRSVREGLAVWVVWCAEG